MMTVEPKLQVMIKSGLKIDQVAFGYLRMFSAK